MTASENSLDSILVQVGDFGKYQIIVFSFVCLAVVFHSAVNVAYVFTAMDLDYRCAVPECDSGNPEFKPPWLSNAIPYENGEISKCLKFVRNDSTNFNNCSKKSDFSGKKETCNSFVYKTNEYSILREYNLQCDLWKLTLVGSVNNVGQFFGLFISGIISDRYGRKIVLILGLTFCGICGLSRTFAPSYIWFLVFEFLDAAFGAGSYICGFIIGVELVGPKKRLLTGTLVSSCYAVGEVFAAGAAWIVQAWKPTIYILYTPPLLLLTYFWIIPESVRWNLSKGKIEEAKKTLRRLAEVNGKTIPDSSFDKLAVPEETISKDTYLDVLKSPTLLLRLINACFCWITCAFLFYGLTLNSKMVFVCRLFRNRCLLPVVRIHSRRIRISSSRCVSYGKIWSHSSFHSSLCYHQRIVSNTFKTLNDGYLFDFWKIRIYDSAADSSIGPNLGTSTDVDVHIYGLCCGSVDSSVS